MITRIFYHSYYYNQNDNLKLMVCYSVNATLLVRKNDQIVKSNDCVQWLCPIHSPDKEGFWVNN